MKLKNIKKKIKQYLFNLTFLKNDFLAFEIKSNFVEKKLNESFFVVESFLKTTHINSQILKSIKIKFPTVIKSLTSLESLLEYFLFLKKSNNLSKIYLVKIHFFSIEKDISVLKTIFLNNKTIKLFNLLLFIVIKKSKIINMPNTLFY